MGKRTMSRGAEVPVYSVAQPGASAIKCCYAATGMYMTVAAGVLRESGNTRTSLSHKTARRRDAAGTGRYPERSAAA